jgi:cardiolipin synthase
LAVEKRESGDTKEIAMNQHTLFTNVQDYYADLVNQLWTAQTSISMTYLSFDSGEWAKRMSEVLCSKALSGLTVRLMVDEFGQLLDEPKHILSNIALFKHLRSCGVQVDVYRPAAPLTMNNRMHCKIVAIDGRTAFLGGSNVGDYYTTWTDSNLRVDGDLGNTFHDLYDFLLGHSQNGDSHKPSLDVSNLWADNERVRLTVPGQRHDIREALLQMIRNAETSIFIRTWYFLPDEEMLAALCDQARKGVQVNVLLSHETRVRPVDFANYIHVHKLVCAGGNVYRYAGRYMHSKAAWNDKGEVLFGSANLDPHSMHINFESCLQIRSEKLAWELRRAFYADLVTSPKQTRESYSQRSLANKALTHACSLVSEWL